jgi:hypothetical protein
VNRLRRLLAAVLAGLLALSAAAGPVLGAEPAEKRIAEMLKRAKGDEPPTSEDQRLARQLLRDWRLSEQNEPMSDRGTARQIDDLLLALSEGRRVPAGLLNRVETLERDCTEEVLAARQRSAALGGGRPSAPLTGEGAEEPAEGTTAGDWFLPVLSVLILLGGVAVSVLARHRKRPDNRAYYQ